MFDMMKMLGKVQEAQKKVKEAQERLKDIEVTAEAGAGMVKATVNGKKQLLNLDIDKDLIKPEESEMLNDLIVAAVNKALEEAEQKAKEEIKKSTEGMLPNIPGMDLGSLF
ncbi:YbaB/EbfC family nucleoid-associated protein [Xanthovirga aplysinae]|uniref:YbaB/EbfC family nucleoid-associated protein n=1 Tax=Xanthovirga aplysinae TaxID=2529853 RepID=UPI0012BC4BE0|nr:YbaB/EbfC family nucleoid-associated protein [Xanthovirga aplysinae]MTI33534.1 YbaB/EbfC family nucleoid-associated protein [Xanthovirga aplysinae]